MNQALLTSLGVSHQALDHVCSIVKNFGELILVRTEVKGTFYEDVLRCRILFEFKSHPFRIVHVRMSRVRGLEINI
jgi:hypothetical protein